MKETLKQFATINRAMHLLFCNFDNELIDFLQMYYGGHFLEKLKGYNGDRQAILSQSWWRMYNNCNGHELQHYLAYYAIKKHGIDVGMSVAERDRMIREIECWLPMYIKL